MAELHPMVTRAEQLGLSPAYQRYARLSLAALEIYSNVPMWVPAHLQTREYALAGHRARQSSTGWSDNEAEWRAQYRVDLAQEVLANPLQRRDWYIGETALRQRVGGRKTMLGQLDHLAALAEGSGGENIRIVPNGTDAHLGMDGTVEIYHDEREGVVMHEVGFDSDRFDTTPRAIRRAELAFVALDRIALSGPDSLSLIKTTATHLIHNP